MLAINQETCKAIYKNVKGFNYETIIYTTIDIIF